VRGFLGSRVSSHVAFFMSFKWVSPGYLGDPYGCPRQLESSQPWQAGHGFSL
jgi:hypothetical protein